MEIKELLINDIKPSQFNPRITLTEADEEYQQILSSINTYGMVEPLVVNKVNNCCLGGHQRLQVLKDMGVKSCKCVLVEVHDESKEKALCIALNKIHGEWDEEKLTALISDEEITAFVTGFSQTDIDIDRYIEQNDLDGEEADEVVDEQNDLDGEEADEVVEQNVAIRISNYMFKITMAEYQSMLQSIREDGYFAKDDIVAELQRRLEND